VLHNETEVVNQIHAEKSLVAFYNVFQVFAGKFFAFVTKFDIIVQKRFTSFLWESALFVSGSTTFTIRRSYALGFNIMFQSKVAASDSAIHATGGYQFHFHDAIPQYRIIRKPSVNFFWRHI